jgi:acetyl-CoA carboxylase alpha subunit
VERRRATARAYYHRHREKILAKQRRPEVLERRRASRIENRDAINARRREAKFKLVRGEYEEMLAQQEGLCAVCRRPERNTYRGHVRSLAVDHDHVTGSVRGLLCSACNTALGKFEDNLAALRAAITYLEAHGN